MNNASGTSHRLRLFWYRIGISLGFSVLAAFLMVARLTGYGESWSDRAQILTLMAAMAGFLAALGSMSVLVRAPWQGTIARAGIAGGMFGAFYLASFGLSYVIQSRLISGHFEPNPDRPIVSLIFSSLQTAGMFVVSAPHYLLPWILPALMLTAAGLLPRCCIGPPGSAP